jgi:RimJ/RimL family protein N-acetyltransferase
MVERPLPRLENGRAILDPLEETDFEPLYTVACDPAIWEQHPASDRWRREIFQHYFDGAIESRGAYRIIEKSTGLLAGSTRIYDADPERCRIKIGYTFLATRCWGTGLNLAVKELLLNELFSTYQEVLFEIGAQNLRSQIAIERLGACRIEASVPLLPTGALPSLLLYGITREQWSEQGRRPRGER